MGHVHKDYDGTPCELCGAKGPIFGINAGGPFKSMAALTMHRTWHIKHGEAELVGGKLVPTQLGLERYGGPGKESRAIVKSPKKNQHLAEPPTRQEEQVAQLDQLFGQKSLRAMQSMEKSVALMKIAMLLEDMESEQVLQLVTNISLLSRK